MRDWALRSAGLLAVFVALVHGALAELKVFASARIEPRSTRRLLRLVWQASTVDWIGLGILLIAAPSFGSDLARSWIAATAIAVYSYAALGNALATRSWHPGWVLMTVVVGLTLVGL